MNTTVISTPSRLVRLGAFAFILATVQFYIIHLIVESAWPRSYSWLLYNISDLGNVTCGMWNGSDNLRYVCSPLHTWMNLSLMAQGSLLVLGVISTWNAWRSKVVNIAPRILLIMVGIGWFLAGFYPADVNENLHVLGAFLIFFLGNIGIILLEAPMRIKAKRAFRRLSILLGVIGLTTTVLFLNHTYLGLGMGGMERLAVFPLQLWFLFTGYVFLKPTQ
jgi:hypothetical membrane protein